MPEKFIDQADLGAPRVTACINAVIKLYPGDSKAALARYFEAVHQELAPLARDLEREITDLKHDIERHLAIIGEQAARITELEEAYAVGAFPSSLTPPLRRVLGMMLWETGPIAHALRATGEDIARKAEDEQAVVLHWLVGFVLKHGADWHKHAAIELRAMTDSMTKPGEQKP